MIDQSNFCTNLQQIICGTLSIQGKKSINLPLGNLKLQKGKFLDIMVKTCSSVKMLTQNKRSNFSKKKLSIH